MDLLQIILLILLILGVAAIAAYAFSPRARALVIHLGWVGLFLIFLGELIARLPKH